MRGNAPVVSAQRKLAVRVSRSQVMTSKAYLREYPDPEFIEEVKENFPEQPIANVEEARVCLFPRHSHCLCDVSYGMAMSCRCSSPSWDTSISM